MPARTEALILGSSMRKDKYGRRYNRPVYLFALFLVLATVVAVLLMRFMAD